MSVNKAIVIGHLGKDPEVRYTTSGVAAASFTVATTEKWKDKNGEKQEKTEWHNISAYNRLAEICGEFLKKGSLVFIEGKLTTEKWTDKEGHDRYTTKIVANEMRMLSGKGDGSTAHTQAPVAAPKAAPAQGGAFDNFPDDVPF